VQLAANRNSVFYKCDLLETRRSASCSFREMTRSSWHDAQPNRKIYLPHWFSKMACVEALAPAIPIVDVYVDLPSTDGGTSELDVPEKGDASQVY